MSSKIKDLITVFLIQLVLTMPFYAASAYGLTISNVKVSNVASNSATIEWNTNNLSNGRIRYGKTTFLGFTQRHDNFIENHTVALFNGIDSDTSYFFIVESTDLAGNTAIDNNSNNFYTFKTTDITPPPQVTGLKVLSTTSSSIFLSWDSSSVADFNHYVVYRNRVPIANTTTNSFNDTGLSPSKDYNYKVSAVDNSSNEGPQSDTLIVSTSTIDSAAPLISNIDVASITDTTARVTWLTNENATTIVLYGINKTDKVKSSADLEINHSIVIDGLTKNARVLFIVKSCDASNNCANSSNQSFIAGRDTTLPFINLAIPRFVNRRVIDIIGTTEPFSSVTLFVNNMNAPKRSLSINEIGSSGKFVFSQIQLEKDNVIKIVMVDKAGNKNQKIFEVSIDTEDPVVQLNDVPSLTSKINLTISGFVNEPVTIRVFVDTNVNSSLPFKITGLNTTKIGQNSVELRWDEVKDKDFSHYAVYRNGIPIAITKPSNFNLFIDALADSGVSYTYQVSAVNIFAKEGPKSEPLTIATPKGGAILNLAYPEVDIFEDFRKPLLNVNATGSFNFGVRLDKGDANYNIKLIFEDRAENSVIIERSVTLDTAKPEVKITSPPSGAFIFENVANGIDIIGKTEPNARVHLFIDRTPFTLFNESFEISGLPNEIQDITEAQLDAKCRLSVAAKSFCRTGADFSVDADSQGNFKFERVDLTAGVFPPGSAAGRVREVPVAEFRDFRLEEGKESKTTTLVVIATDKTGQRGFVTQGIRIGTCWSGNQSWDIIPLTQYQSPTFLSTERLVEGTETIYFYLNYSYIGRGTTPVITGIDIRKACSTRETLDPRFNISCQIMPAGIPTQLLKISTNPAENTVSYSSGLLSRSPGMDRFLEDDWKTFFDAINKELTFPLFVRISYKHDANNDGTLEPEVQTTCEQVSYTVDNTIIDPRRILPDWLLFDFVDFLQDSLETLTDVQEQLNKLIDYVAIGCFASGGIYLSLQIYRRFTSFLEERAYTILTKSKINEFYDLIGKIQINPEKEEYKQDCQELIKKIVEKHGSFKLKYVNDFDLKRCFPASASAWGLESKTWQLTRYSCDRIFGHSSPSKWTETKDDSYLIRKAQSIEGCQGDEGALGQPLKVESCREVARKNPAFKAAETFGADAKCTIVSEKSKRNVFLIGNPLSETEGLYEIQHISATGGLSGETKYAVKSRQSEFNYITAQSDTCQERCAGKRVGKKDQLSIEGKKVEVIKDDSGAGVSGYCTTVEKCKSLNAKDSQTRFTLGTAEIKYARNWGFTKDCFYEPGDPANVVSYSLSTREECCCIYTQDLKGIKTNYYDPKDTDVTNTKKFVHESKSVLSKEPQSQSNDDKGLSDMKWSYRYSKEKFEALASDGKTIHNLYHPNRYIEGRDFPACFGWNHIVYENPLGIALGEPEKVLMLNPSQDHVAALQCVHLAGINQRIQFIKNLMSSLSTCLIQVRTTGRGDAGACKELFTQYLCNSIWQVIRLLTDDGCATTEYGEDTNLQSDKIVEYVRAGFKSVSDSVSDLQSSINQEYGNAKLNELLGTGEESIARKLCLAAFGYDWEINLRNLVDAAYTTPFATLVQPITRSREFLTIDPITFRPRYEYRASWIINPGCDFERYDVYLACVSRKELDQYPNQIDCGAVGAPSIAYSVPITTPIPIGSSTTIGGRTRGTGQCDCIGLSEEKRRQVFTGTNLKQNSLEDKSIPPNNRVIDDNWRFDHLKFVLRTDRKIPSNIKPNCFPTGYDDGVFYAPLLEKTARDIFDCRIDALSGSATPCCEVDQPSGALKCGGGAAFASRKGTAEFIDLKVNEQNALGREDLVFTAGDILKVDTTVRNVGQNKCIKLTFDAQSQIDEVFEGIQQYTLQTQQLSLGTRNEIQEPAGIKVQRINLGNTKEVSINVRFWDNNKNLIFTDPDDEISVDGTVKKIQDIIDSPNSKITISEANEEEVQVSRQQIILKKEKAEVAIVAVEVQRNLNTGAPIKDDTKGVPFVQGTIRIFPPSDTAAATQTQPLTRTLTIGLYHTRDDPNVFGISACDQNEPVLTISGGRQEKNIRIRIDPRPEFSALQGPIIRVPAGKLTFRKDVGNFIITTTITHSSGIERAQMDCTGPHGKTINQLLGTNAGGNRYDFIINPDDITVAGEYNCKITAKSRNQQARENSETLRFEVECGPQDRVYGKCQTNVCKAGDKTITEGLLCA